MVCTCKLPTAWNVANAEEVDSWAVTHLLLRASLQLIHSFNTNCVGTGCVMRSCFRRPPAHDTPCSPVLPVLQTCQDSVLEPFARPCPPPSSQLHRKEPNSALSSIVSRQRFLQGHRMASHACNQHDGFKFKRVMRPALVAAAAAGHRTSTASPARNLPRHYHHPTWHP